MAARGSKRRLSKARAIRSGLARLGLQASANQIVESLAQHGIAVSQALVEKVKIEMAKDTAATRRQLASLRQTDQRPAVLPVRKTPAGRQSRR